MTAQHTPGPWEWLPATEDTDDAVVAITSFVMQGAITSAANARLIAAAPDLLEACAAIVAWCDKNPPSGDALYCIQQARAAIAKATGGAA